ncbi:hypothetical protein FRC17_006351 [Serendipita sp. 399]|nr:hypothetical protein FRC17_006351 [Serendipita sp. 399]
MYTVVAVIICAILIFCCMRILRRKKATKAPKDAVLPMTTTNEQAAYGQPTSYTPQPHPEYQQATQQPYGGGQQQYNAHQTEYNAVSSYGGQPQGAAGYAPPPGPPTFPVAPSGY